MTHLVSEEQKGLLLMAIRSTIQALIELERNLPSSFEGIYKDIPQITDGLLDLTYRTLNLSDSNKQKIFPTSVSAPALYSDQREMLINSARKIESDGLKLIDITLNTESLTQEREMGPGSEITKVLKSTISAVCTLSDFTFPTHEVIESDGQNAHFRIIVNDDIEYRIE